MANERKASMQIVSTGAEAQTDSIIRGREPDPGCRALASQTDPDKPQVSLIRFDLVKIF